MFADNTLPAMSVVPTDVTSKAIVPASLVKVELLPSMLTNHVMLGVAPNTEPDHGNGVAAVGWVLE